MDKRDFDEIREDFAANSLAADMAEEFPHSYSIDEAIDITARLDEASAKADKLMRDDYAILSDLEQKRLMGLLSEHSEQSRQWWRDYLLG